MRAFHDLTQNKKYARKLITCLTNRGGVGGVGSNPQTVATSSDHPGGWELLPHLGTQQWQPYEEGGVNPA
eukprot:8603008-Pyramimonas_sp.AAC.1